MPAPTSAATSISLPLCHYHSILFSAGTYRGQLPNTESEPSYDMIIALSKFSRRLPQCALRFFGTVFFLSVLTLSAQASPDSVLVVTAGEEADQALLLANASKALGDAQVNTADMGIAELNGFDATATIVCLEQGDECSKLVRTAPAKWLLLLRLTRESGDPDADHKAIASLFSAEDGKLLQTKFAVCQSCSSRERMAKIVTELVKGLAEAELATRAQETYITVNANPDHGVLKIDGQVVGPCGQAYQVTPGEHRIEVVVEGYHTVTQSVLVEANENKSISITLSVSRMDKASEGGGWKKPVGWGLGLAGIGGLVGGIIVFSQDGDPVAADSGMRPSRTKDRKLSGALVSGAGVLGILGGVLLLLTSDDADASSDKTTIITQPSRDGFSVGLSGHF